MKLIITLVLFSVGAYAAETGAVSQVPNSPGATVSSRSQVETTKLSIASPFYERESIAPKPNRSAVVLFDRRFVTLAGISLAANIFDLEATARTSSSGRGREMNPLFGARPSRARLYGTALPLWALSLWGSHYYRKHTPESKWWQLPMIVGAVAHAAAGTSNLRSR